MFVTPEIKKALQRFVERCGNPYQASLRVGGIGNGTITKWITEDHCSMTDSNWEKVKPYLKPYLDIEACENPAPYTSNNMGMTAWNTEDVIKKDPNLTPLQKKELLLRLQEMKIDRELGIAEDGTIAKDPSSGAAAG